MRLKNLLISGSLTLIATSAFAIPAKIGVQTVTQPDGTTIQIQKTGDEHLLFVTTPEGYLLTKDADGFYRLADIDDAGNVVSLGVTPSATETPRLGKKLSDVGARAKSSKRRIPQEGVGMFTNNYPTTGTPRCCVILCEYADVKFSEDFDYKDYITRMLNEDGFSDYGAKGSVRDYLREQSGGLFVPEFDVYGPVTLPENREYYGKDYGTMDTYSHKMVTHACDILNPDVDFSKYDENKDGNIDFIYIFYAGQGQHNFGDENTVYPHSGELQRSAEFKMVDGKMLNLYACSNELEGDRLAGMGNFLHEYFHVLGLPDLYYTGENFTVNFRYTPGQFSIMDYGLYNNNAYTPCNLSAYERNALNWQVPQLAEEPSTFELKDISSGQMVLIPTSKSDEFYLLENRQQTGWDEYIPAHGLVIWHVAYEKFYFSNNQVNLRQANQGVEIIKPNGKIYYHEPEVGLANQLGWTYPGETGKTEFSTVSDPAMVPRIGKVRDLPVTDIAESEDGIVSFNVAGGAKTDGVSAIEAAGEGTPVYYNLQGVRVENPAKGQILIRHLDGKATKVVY